MKNSDDKIDIEMGENPFQSATENETIGNSARPIRRRRVAFVLSLMAFASVASAAPVISSQTNPAVTSMNRWNPRKVPAGARFVGDKVCAECHSSKVASQTKTSMAMALETVAESKVLVANPVMTFKSGNYSFRIERKENQSIYTITNGDETISLPILYAFGQGKAGQTYLLHHEGAFYEGLLSYYREVGGLDFTIGQSRTVPKSMIDAIGRKLPETETLNCFSCHSTGAVSGGKLDLTKVTPGVRCEACHGPGEQHVAASKALQASAKLIFNPRRLSGDELSQDFCASCHRGNDEFALLKGQEINNVRFQPYRIFHSKCYSDDRRITCTACHNPHEPLRQDAAFYDAKCYACHASKDKPAVATAGTNSQKMEKACPVDTKNCADCHMPRLGPDSAHFKFTDHYIRVVRPKESYPN